MIFSAWEFWAIFSAGAVFGGTVGVLVMAAACASRGN